MAGLSTKGTEEHMEGFNEMWKAGDKPWDSRGVNPLLLKYQDVLLPNRKPAKVFVPLCGKDDCMKWLAEQGHQVIGLEYSDIPCKEFFEENGLEYDKTVIQDVDIKGYVYKTSGNTELSIKIYCCDYFRFIPEMEKDFDAVWDRGALNSMDRCNLERYVSVIKPLMKDNCVNLTEIVLGDFPETHSMDIIQTAFGEQYEVVALDSVEPFFEHYRQVGVTSFDLFCIKRIRC